MTTNNNYFKVLKIHNVKKEKGKKLYLVEWDGFPESEEYTWEPYINLKDCSIFQKYRSEMKNQGTKRKKENGGILVKDIFQQTKRGKLSKDERSGISSEQNNKCNLCLNLLGSYYEIDHIIPLEQGGTNDFQNLQALCASCHRFKTTVLDRGVIARILQAKLQNTKNEKMTKVTRTHILEECQMVYFNRNRTRTPFHNDEMLNFCIDTADIYREMCKKEVKKRINYIMKISDSNIDNEIKDESDTKQNQPPESLTLQKISVQRTNTYLNNLIIIINRLVCMKIKSTVINTNKFLLTLSITLDEKQESDDKIYDFIDEFFKEVYVKNLSTLEKTIGCVTILYEK